LSTTKPDPIKDQRWYGRRSGRKLRPQRQGLLDNLLPQIRVDLSPGAGMVDLPSLFSDSIQSIWMEIGFGTGEHLAALAARHPEIGFIGCEPYINGVAALLTKINENGLSNIRIYDDDVRLLIPRLPEACLARLFVLFADPWPKTRHHRRRITVPENLDEFARLLADEGEMLFASDQHDFAAWSLSNMLRQPNFEWLARCRADWTEEPAGWAPTRYQAKADKKGLAPVFLRLRRRPRGAT
jgi:tRNA (guanine-N7-)-methyltransferase